MIYEGKFLISLGLTLLVEVPALWLLQRYLISPKLATRRVVATGLLASSLTLPYVWFVLPPYVDAAYYLQISEAFAIAVEALLFCLFLKISPAKALLISAAANMASFIAGFALL